MDTLLQTICDGLRREHNAHTILLYGSRADYSANEFSDYDVAAFANVKLPIRDTRVIGGQFLDVFLHPEEVLTRASADYLTLRGSKILSQRNDEATLFLAQLDDIFDKGPDPLATDEIQARCTWARKMAQRMRRTDIEGNYRRTWLLTALLEDYFYIRTLWYQGPKKALQWLQREDPSTYVAFDTALKPEASFDSIDLLIERVTELPWHRTPT